MSWISFWLEPSAIPGRTTLGTASWLTFINLNKNLNDQISRVAYIKFGDVWFFVCTLFIFSSLLEFALVNYIARSKDKVVIQGQGSIGIIKEGLKEVSRSAFTTPSLRCDFTCMMIVCISLLIPGGGILILRGRKL